VTFLPLRPLFSLPRFIALISRSTDLPAFGLYLRSEDFFARPRAEVEPDLDEVALRREREVLERFAAVLRFDAVRRLPVDVLREERLRVDFLVAAIESSLLDFPYFFQV
jgi:hypothetical protein